jgi:hypothetical protein
MPFLSIMEKCVVFSLSDAIGITRSLSIDLSPIIFTLLLILLLGGIERAQFIVPVGLERIGNQPIRVTMNVANRGPEDVSVKAVSLLGFDGDAACTATRMNPMRTSRRRKSGRKRPRGQEFLMSMDLDLAQRQGPGNIGRAEEPHVPGALAGNGRAWIMR